MRIEWINHAGFVAQAGETSLACDPWIEGFVFDNSWALISPTKFRYTDFSAVTHIWFSHEHPDHFYPPNLKRIPEEARKAITVLFKTTKDKRVVKFCRGLGFKAALELPDCQWTSIGSEMSVFCKPIDRGDSWLAIRTPDHTVLDLNDCIYQTEDQLRVILGDITHVDTLITQFSYANWWGNPDEKEKWINAARDTLSKVDREICVLKPKHVVLSASFVYFCHEENLFMNEHINRVEDVYRHLRANPANPDAEPVVLYPGDTWEPGKAWESDLALQRYLADYKAALDDSLKVPTVSVTLETLTKAAGAFMRTLRRNNSRLLLQRLPSVSIDVYDLDASVQMDLHGIKPLPRDNRAHDIRLSSKALLYCLRFPWGGETLLINGRFHVPHGGDRGRFFRWFNIAQANSRWTYYNRDYYVNKALGKVQKLIGLQA